MDMAEAESVVTMSHRYFILDPSALVYGGIGKIKQWIETTIENYKSHKRDREDVQIIFYVPSYTLQELDFLKKVFNPLISANARESIKFIDNQISDSQFDLDLDDNDDDNHFGGTVSDLEFSDEEKEEEEGEVPIDSDDDIVSIDSDLLGFNPTHHQPQKQDQRKNKNNKSKRSGSKDYMDFESYNKMKSNKNRALKSSRKDSFKPVVFILESETDVGPDWKIASGYRRSTPLLSQLPKPINGYSSRGQLVNDDNRKITVGVFGNNIPGTFNVFNKNNTNVNSFGVNNNNSNNNVNVNTINSDEKAIVPMRLKFFIRSCIQKQYIENKLKKESEKINWDIICEDATTAIWLKSFGLSVKTLNDVQQIFDTLNNVSDNSTSNTKATNVLFDPVSGTFVDSESVLSSKNEKKFNERKSNGFKNRRRSAKERKEKGNEKKAGLEEKQTNEKKGKKERKSKSNNSKEEKVVTPNTEEKENSKITTTPKSSKSRRNRRRKGGKASTTESNSSTNNTNIDIKKAPTVLSPDNFAERGQGELWTP